MGRKAQAIKEGGVVQNYHHGDVVCREGKDREGEAREGKEGKEEGGRGQGRDKEKTWGQGERKEGKDWERELEWECLQGSRQGQGQGGKDPSLPITYERYASEHEVPYQRVQEHMMFTSSLITNERQR